MRILLLGIAPLPFERSKNHSAPGLRAWQFCQPLLADGHRVCLVTFGEPLPGEPAPAGEGLTRVCLAPGDFMDQGRLQQELSRFGPDAVVAASSYQCTRAASLLGQLAPDLPLWVDLPGDMMAEAQLRAATAGVESDPGEPPVPDFVADYRSILLPALGRADRFSVVSARQRLCLVGQLGLAGRLGPETLGQELVAVIPASVEAPPATEEGKPPEDLPDEGRFVIISSGSFNTWMDIETLFEGLSRAMSRDSRIHFVAAGGAVSGHCEAPLARFKSLVRGSRLRHRFHLRGWLWPEQLRGLYARADLGLNLDLPCYEAELGSRNRVLDWLRHGLCCLTTPCSEFTAELTDLGLALAVPPAEPEALARLLCQLAGPRRGELAPMAEAARRHVLQRQGHALTTAPLRRWARAPARAGDTSRGEAGAAVPSAADLQAEAHRLRRQLDAVQSSRAYGVLRRGERLASGLKRSIFGKKPR